MVKLKKASVFLVLILILTGGRPMTGWGAGWEELRQAAAQIKSLQTDFVQEKHLKILRNPVVSKGRLYFSPPGRLRWEYISPIKSVVLMRRDKMDMYLWSEGRWTLDDGRSIEIRRTVLDEISGWFSGRFKDTSSFTPSLVSGPPTRIVLTPRQGLKGFIERVVLTLSRTPGVMESVEIVEGAEAKTRIRFMNVRLNKPLPEKIFEKP